RFSHSVLTAARTEAQERRRTDSRGCRVQAHSGEKRAFVLWFGGHILDPAADAGRTAQEEQARSADGRQARRDRDRQYRLHDPPRGGRARTRPPLDRTAGRALVIATALRERGSSPERSNSQGSYASQDRIRWRSI